MSTTNKKETLIPTKFLNKSQAKQLIDKMNKKIKFTVGLEVDGMLKNSQYNTIYGAINTSNFFMIVKLKLPNGKYSFVGCYSPGKSYRT